MRFPKYIDCSIQEAIFEVRFASELSEELVVGICLTKLRPFIDKIDQLPTVQIPKEIREREPELAYASTHRITLKGTPHQSILLGPRVIVFSHTEQYAGWDHWSASIKQAMDVLLEESYMFDRIERIGLRYINLFPFSILDKINVEISYVGQPITDQFVSTRLEFVDQNRVTSINIVHNGMIALNSKTPTSGSVIDIDSIVNLAMNHEEFKSHYQEVLEESHEHEKQTFFSLLSENFLAQLHPVYD